MKTSLYAGLVKNNLNFTSDTFHQIGGWVLDAAHFFTSTVGLPGGSLLNQVDGNRISWRSGGWTLYEAGKSILYMEGLTTDSTAAMNILTEEEADGYAVFLQREMRGFYYTSATTAVRVFVLWFLRRLPIPDLFDMADHLAVLFPSIADKRDVFKSAVGKAMNLKSKHATAYDLLRVLLSDVTLIVTLQQYYELLCTFANLLGCAAVAVLRRIPGWEGKFDVSACCTETLVKEFLTVQKRMQSKRDDVVSSAPPKDAGYMDRIFHFWNSSRKSLKTHAGNY